MEMDRLIVAAIDTPSPRAAIQQLDAVTAALPRSAIRPVVNAVLPDFNDELRKLPAVETAGGERSVHRKVCSTSRRWWRSSIAISTSTWRRWQASTLRTAQSHQEPRSISVFISIFAVLALIITGCACWYIYRNHRALTAISRAMSRLAHGEQSSVPALQRRDELERTGARV